MNIYPLFIVVDLFCGAGGTTTGFTLAENGIAKVIACVNHDPKAIKSHWWNHSDVKHFNEDIRILDLTELVKLVEAYRIKYPDAKLILWASLECTNFSKAKGGQPRNADSRTLADHLDRYILALNPDYIQIENVVEFMSWGPLDEFGKPVSKKNGKDFLRWRKEICEIGYYDEWQEMNSANFGAYTSRNRLFGCFAKHGLPIAWPEPTHARNPSSAIDLFNSSLQKWKAVKEVLDLQDEGESIFNRKKPLSDKTFARIYAGLLKYVVKEETTSNILFQYLVNPSHGGHCTGIHVPCPVIIARQDKAPLYLVQVKYGSYNVPIYEDESEIVIKIKRYMVSQGLVDIRMRMLRVQELLRIQGFPINYQLEGNQNDQKKFIGNSVVPVVVKRWIEAIGLKLISSKKKVA